MRRLICWLIGHDDMVHTKRLDPGEEIMIVLSAICGACLSLSFLLCHRITKLTRMMTAVQEDLAQIKWTNK